MGNLESCCVYGQTRPNENSYHPTSSSHHHVKAKGVGASSVGAGGVHGNHDHMGPDHYSVHPAEHHGSLQVGTD